MAVPEPDPLNRPSQPARSITWWMQSRPRFLIPLALVVALVTLIGPFARSAAIINGPVVSPAPSWIAAFVSPDGIAHCTGALIAPNLVITVKHCDPPAYAQIVIGRSDVKDATGSAPVGIASSINHPTTDLALHILKQSVNLAPLAIGSDDPSSDPMSFIPFTVYGYGRTNDLNQPTPATDGLLRSAVGEITACATDIDTLTPNFCLKPVKIAAPCSGDSGAPLVASNHLMGILTSNIVKKDHQQCLGSGWGAISVPNREIKQWVDDVMNANPPS
jgi:hypothetical protein